MIRNHRRSRVLVAALAALAVSGIGMAGTATAQSGEVSVSGSSTVEPITSLVAELFAEKHPDVQVRVDGPGTGDGFKLFCAGDIDISNASRPIKDEEAAACSSADIEYTELAVALDGLTVIVNKDSDLGLTCLSQADLYALFGPESTGDLADASALAEELGSTQTLPTSGAFKKFTPGPESGTYDAFIELGYQDILDARVAAGDVTDLTPSDDGENEATEPIVSDGQFANDNDVVKRVEASENGIGFLGIAYFTENADNLKAVAIENPDTGTCVRPSEKAVQNGAYLPLSRPLYIYVDDAKATDNSSVGDFVDFYMTKKHLTSTVEEAGYAPLPAEQVTQSINTWKSVG